MKRLDTAIAFFTAGVCISFLLHGDLPVYGHVTLYCTLAWGGFSLIDFKDGNETKQ